MYQNRMLGYYPPVIQSILEFKAIIDAEYPEIEEVSGGRNRIISDAYLSTMSEERIKQWESVLGISPIVGSTAEDRQETIIARIRGQGKLNTELINSIVGAFTGGTAESYIEDGVLHVKITPPPDNKQYQFSNVVQELSKKIPAHLGLNVQRNYSTWGDIYNNFKDWNAINELSSWEELMVLLPSE